MALPPNRSRCSATLRLTPLLALVLTVAVPARAEEALVISALEWRGVEALPTTALVEAIRTSAPPWLAWLPGRAPALDESLLDADLERIENLYRRRGYYEARAQYALEPTRRAGRVRVIFEVAEGEPARVASRSIRIEYPDPPPAGVETPSGDELGAELEGGQGEIFDVDAYQRARSALLERLAENGFPSADLEAGGAEVDVAARAATVQWTLRSGPAVRIAGVTVDGLEHADREFVRGMIELEEGELLRPSLLAEVQRRLVDLGLFRTVVVEATPARSAAPEAVVPDEPAGEAGTATPGGLTPEQAETDGFTQRWPVEVRVVERPPRTLSLGIGYATDERVRGRLSWEHRNLLGEARRISLAARFSALLAGFEGRVSWPRLRASPWGLALSANLLRERAVTFDADRVEAGVHVARDLPGGLALRVGHALEWSRTRDVSDATEALLDADDTTLLSLVQLRLDRLAVDDPTRPSRGWRLELGGDLSTPTLGSQLSYVRADADLRHYRPLPDLGLGLQIVVAARVRLTAIQTFSGDRADDVPLTKRLFAGGGDSVRGYAYQELGPLDAENEPIGGVSRLISSVELRFPLYGPVSGVMFSDAGQVSPDSRDWRLGDLRHTAGGGVRVDTPVGPVRLDLGYQLNPLRDSTRRFEAYLSIGHAF